MCLKNSGLAEIKFNQVHTKRVEHYSDKQSINSPGQGDAPNLNSDMVLKL